MSAVGWLRSLGRRDFATLMAVTAVLCAAFGFAGGRVLVVYGPQQGAKTAPAGVVTDAWPTRGDP